MVAGETIFITTVLCTTLSGLAYLKKVLTWDGSLAAFAVGFIIGIFGDILWLFLLLIFLVTSFAATKYRFEAKEILGVQEGVEGERRCSNVLANGLAPTIIALISSFSGFPKDISGLLFVSAISVAASDTLASEIGVLANKTYRITTLETVRPGTDGGVSWLGEGAALGAALYTSLAAWLFLEMLPPGFSLAQSYPSSAAVFFIPAVVGFIGCQIDSLLGATLETRKIISKKTNNFVSTTLGALLAYGLYVLTMATP